MGKYWDNGKSNGNYYSILGVYRDNGKENGSYHSIMGCGLICRSRFLSAAGREKRKLLSITAILGTGTLINCEMGHTWRVKCT